jgi:sulfide:quinone oxidoreductase
VNQWVTSPARGKVKLRAMTTDPASSAPFEVLIAGGSVAALEGALALRNLAGDRVSITLIAPNREFVYRPMTVQEPFAYGLAQRYPVEEIVRGIGAELIEDSLQSVNAAAARLRTASGSEHRYDALLVALGAQIRARYEYATTIDDRHLDDQLHGLVQDVEGGYVKHLAFVIPPRMSWPLPVYELALMTAVRAYDSDIELSITVLTPEDAPLAVFGRGASSAVSRLLADRQIEVITSAYCEIPRPGQIEVSPGGRTVRADRIVALPELEGPAVRGLPADENGFIPVDANCRIRGLEREFAAGDVVEFSIKHGGIAAHQADIAATMIASLAGAPVEPETFRPMIHGILLTGEKPRYLKARITGGHGFSSELTDEPSWSSPAKIAAKYLAPYLEQRDRAAGRSGS